MSDLTGKFFDVYPGRYRCMPVVVKQVRNVDHWSKEVFQVFLHEVEVIRSVCLSVCVPNSSVVSSKQLQSFS